MRRLVPVQAVLRECQFSRKVVQGRVQWATPRPRVAYEFAGLKYFRTVQLQIEGDAHLSQSEVDSEVLALRSRLGETLTLWVDPQEPARGYVHRRMPELRVWLWSAAAIAYWIFIFTFRQLIVPDPRQPGAGELVDWLQEGKDPRKPGFTR
jgi:hypothetical protein